MTRYIGAALILAASCAFGAGMTKSLKTRVRHLSSLCQALLILKSEICTRLTPLSDAFEKLSREGPPAASGLFDLALEGMKELGSVSMLSIWHSAVEGSGLQLTDEERDCLSGVGAVLGSSDIEAQAAALDNAVDRFRMALPAAEEKCASDGKANAMLSMAAGIFVVLILL